jgi:hypothetical protein
MAHLEATHDFHPVYRIWFLWVDPFLTLVGMYGNLWAHDLAVEAFYSNFPVIEQLRPFLYQIGGMGSSYLTIQLTLLRYTEDVNVWKCIQGAITWADFTMLYAIYTGLQHEGNLAVSDWRALDLASIIITVACTVLRIAFVLGIGVTPKKTAAVTTERA